MRFGARLALFALALQLVLSFGHIHPEDLVGAAAAGTHAVAAGQQAGHAPKPSAPHRKSGGDDDICAICALIQLVNTSVASAAPPLPAPSEVRWVDWQIVYGFSSAPSSHRLFRARAPPLA